MDNIPAIGAQTVRSASIIWFEPVYSFYKFVKLMKHKKYLATRSRIQLKLARQKARDHGDCGAGYMLSSVVIPCATR